MIINEISTKYSIPVHILAISLCNTTILKKFINITSHMLSYLCLIATINLILHMIL